MKLFSIPEHLFQFRNVIRTLEIQTQQRLGTAKMRFYNVDMFRQVAHDNNAGTTWEKMNPGLAHGLHQPCTVSVLGRSKQAAHVGDANTWRVVIAPMRQGSRHKSCCMSYCFVIREVSWHGCQSAAENRLILAQKVYMPCNLSYLALPSSFLAAFSAASLPSAAGAD